MEDPREASTRFVHTLLGNRIMNLFLKWQGITTLNTNTMVPLFLLFGREMVQNMIENNQIGSGFLDFKIPFVDDPMLGAYLLMLGLESQKDINMTTMIPLGLAAALYQLYGTPNSKKQNQPRKQSQQTL
jgi:hypothetical protein